MLRLALAGALAALLAAHDGCTRRGTAAAVDVFYNGDTTPIVAGYDGVEPWQYAVLGSRWANNGVFTGSAFASAASGPVVITDTQLYNTTACEELQVTMVAQFAVTAVNGTLPTPAPLPATAYANNPYYGAGLLQAYDPNTGLVYGFIVTNAVVYALYGRLALPGTTYTPFVYLVGIFARGNVLQFNILQLSFSKSRGTVTYRVDGNDRMVLAASGRPIDAQFLLTAPPAPPASYEAVFPQQVQMSIGITPLNMLYPYDGTFCAGIYDYCDCQQTLADARHTPCRDTGTDPTSFNSALGMVVGSLGVSRVYPAAPLCVCGEEESSDTSCRPQRPCLRKESSASSTCDANSDLFSFW